MTDDVRVEGVTLPEEGHAVRVMAKGVPVVVFRVGGTLYALDARCTHVGGPLDQGTLDGPRVTCPWHHSVFDVRDGSVVTGPAVRAAARYQVQVDGSTLVLEPE
jgi:nitrite reductase/ring-hydroxylating ferredoxin subunit